MTYPGFAAVMLGVSIATLLYYMFADSEQHHDQQQRNSSNRRSPNRQYDSDSFWDSHSDNVRRRRSSGATGNSDKCTICLNPTTTLNRIRLQPCAHVFHISCIKKWKSQGPQGSCHSCPNCRCPFINAM